MKIQKRQQLTMSWRSIAPGVRIKKETLTRAAELFAELIVKSWKAPKVSEDTDDEEKDDR